MTNEQIAAIIPPREPIPAELIPGVLERLAGAIENLRTEFERYRTAQSLLRTNEERLGRNWDSHIDARLQQCEQTLAIRHEIPARALTRTPEQQAEYDDAMANAPW